MAHKSECQEIVNNPWKEYDESFEWMAWRGVQRIKLMHAGWMRTDGEECGLGN